MQHKHAYSLFARVIHRAYIPGIIPIALGRGPTPRPANLCCFMQDFIGVVRPAIQPMGVKQ